MGLGWKSRIRECQTKHRPKHRDWTCDRLAYPASGAESPFELFVATVLNREDAEKWNARSTFGRGRRCIGHGVDGRAVPYVIDARTTSVGEFVRDHERTGQSGVPTVIQNVPEVDGWRCAPASSGTDDEFSPPSRWSLAALAEDPDLRNVRLKCGEDDYGKSVRIPLRDFIKYIGRNRDDSPLYIFDSTFEDDAESGSALLRDYAAPSFFPEDLFCLVGPKRRPPHLWFLIGPKRSGSTVHIDPLGTSAWNTLIIGVKRWVLFPPDTPKKIVKGKNLIKDNEDDEAIHYFMTILPRIKENAARSGIDIRCYEFNQYPGETVFIPSGWWHAVLNLTDTVGVTQNFCSSQNFDEVWKRTRSGRKKMSWKWLCQLDSDSDGKYSHLAARARALNVRDGYVMKYDDGRFDEENQPDRGDMRRGVAECDELLQVPRISAIVSCSDSMSIERSRGVNNYDKGSGKYDLHHRSDSHSCIEQRKRKNKREGKPKSSRSTSTPRRRKSSTEKRGRRRKSGSHSRSRSRSHSNGSTRQPRSDDSRKQGKQSVKRGCSHVSL